MYRPQPVMELTSLRELAECAYQALTPADKMNVDIFCQRLLDALRDKAGRDNISLQYQSLREYVLAEWLVTTFEGGGANGNITMVKTIGAALQGNRRPNVANPPAGV